MPLTGSQVADTKKDAHDPPGDPGIEAILREVEQLALDAVGTGVEDEPPTAAEGSPGTADAELAELETMLAGVVAEVGAEDALTATAEDLPPAAEDDEPPTGDQETETPRAEADSFEPDASPSPAADDPTSSTDKPRNPWGEEITRLESQWADETPTSIAADRGDSPGTAGPAKHASVAPASGDGAGPSAGDTTGNAPITRPSRLARARASLLSPLRIALAAAVAALVLADIPFAWLGPRAKTLLGYAAIATLFMAVTVWAAGSFLVCLPG